MSAPPSPSPDSIAPGTRFQARYEVLNEIGVGSFGRVYRAEQLSTGQDVALKILRIREGEAFEPFAVQRQRFEREMRLGATLSHPHIVRLIDSGEYGAGTLYAVFEFVGGSTLRQILELEGRLEPAEAVHLMTQVLDALACAHHQGVVHRDLKPENIIVTHSGLRRNATVLDFGLGGFAAGSAAVASARITASRDFMGTPAYAAPEQLRGEPLTPASDLYAWGLILLECLTGEPAIQARTAQDAVAQQLGPEPVAIPGWLREQRLGRLLVAVTAKDVAARDIAEQALLKALEAIARDAAPFRDGEPRRLPIAEGERRQVTVLACTTTVRRTDGGPVDLEDLDQAMQAQHELYDEVVQQSGHTLVRGQMGQVHVVFGYPKAHEDDARRAVRMALRIVALTRTASAALSAERGLMVAVHVGLHSGMGILRVRLASGGTETRVEVVGAPVVLAAQLADRSDDDEVLASAETRALLREEMDCVPAGEALVPDRGAMTTVFRITGERVGSAFDSSIRGDETPLVGRNGELAQLVSVWERAEAGALGIVLLHGEAGIGKSRLVRELRRRVPPESFVACRCTPEGRGTPLHPIAAWLRASPTPLPELLTELEFDVDATWPLFADLLEVGRGDAPEALRLPPERRKELTLRAVAELVVRTAIRRPLVFAVEDLHWEDPTTGELIRVLLDEARAAYLPASRERPGLVLLFSARPEYAATWTGADVTVLPLGRLSRADVARIVNDRRDDSVPADVLDDIVERTDGVPLFVEELAHALGDGDAPAIPGTLRELLTTRLDALSTSAHESAQLAAAIGREVGYPLLQAVSPHDEWVLRQDLMELVDARLLFVRRGAGQEAYVFRHALMRDAAYESMVRATRQRVHRAIASGLRLQLADVADQRPEQLAHHLQEAGELASAAEQWCKAGDRDFRRAAYAEATEHFERALTVLTRLPETPERVRQEIEALTMLGTVHLATTGHSHPRGREAFDRAQMLCETHSLDLSLKIVSHLSGAYIIQGNREAMQVLAPRCERLLQSDDPVAQLTGTSSLGLEAFWRGEHRRARALFDRGLPLYEGTAFRRFAEEYGWDGGIFVPLYSVWNAAVMGADEREAEPARAAALRSFDPQAPAFVHAFAMAAAHVRRDVAAARRHAEEAIAICEQQRFFGLLVLGMCGRGLARVLEGDVEAGTTELETALAMLQAGGALSPHAYYGSYLAEALLAAGRIPEGLAATAAGLAACERSLARVHEPELLRIDGELRGRAGDQPAAENRLRRAVELAREREARAWELRAALSLARALRDRARPLDARTVLRPIVEWFPPDRVLPDLAAARALLAET
jgi:TOMM system kinase/cyclase fusion protein